MPTGLLAALAAFTTSDGKNTPESDTVVLASASRPLPTEYLDNRGDYRRAKATLQPIRGGDRPR